MRTAVTAPKNRLEVVPSPQNEGAKPLIWPRFSPFQRLGHLTAHPRAHLLRRRRPQHVPACHFVQDHTEHAAATPHPQPLQSQPILQAAVGRLDARASRAYRSVNTGVSCSRRRPARRWALSVNSKV